MTIDPVCGMEIDEALTAQQSEYDSVTYYFCSDACKLEFDRDPARYTGAEDSEAPSPSP